MPHPQTPIPIPQVASELCDLHYLMATIDEVISNCDPDLRADHLAGSFWPSIRERVKRLMAMLPPDIDLAECDAVTRSHLHELRTFLDRLWSGYKLDLSVERNFVTDANDVAWAKWLLDRLSPINAKSRSEFASRALSEDITASDCPNPEAP